MIDPLLKDPTAFGNDRLWRITSPNFVLGLTEYNDELTTWAPLLLSLFKNDNCVHYGGNAYYILRRCRERGWKVESLGSWSEYRKKTPEEEKSA